MLWGFFLFSVLSAVVIEYKLFYFMAQSAVVLKRGKELFLKNYKKFLQSTIFWFLHFTSSLLKYKKIFLEKYEIFKLWARKFHFLKFQRDVFYFSSSENSPLDYKLTGKKFFQSEFFYYSRLNWKVCQVALKPTTSVVLDEVGELTVEEWVWGM